MLKIFSFLFSLILCLQCFALEIPKEESVVLEDFFKTLLVDSEVGYVLYGKKPVCIHGFHKEDYFLKENKIHRNSVILREGASAWKKLNFNIPQKDIIIHIYNENSPLENYIHVLAINKALFLETVKHNLSLFQYVLGPDVTPQGLLTQLTDPNNSFHSVLNDDKVLIGILLGFGTQNSIYVSRIENIESALLSDEQTPFKSQLSQLKDFRSEFIKVLLLLDHSNHTVNQNLKPGFGYHSLKDEMHSLSKKIDISSLKLAQQSPPLMFGRLKDDKESVQLIMDLEITQAKINQFNSSINFLKDVLQKILPEEKITIAPKSFLQLPFNKLEIEELPFLVAANMWRTIDNENIDYRKSVIQGLYDSEQGIEPKFQETENINYEKMKALSKANENIQLANEFFLLLDKNSDYITVAPLRLYCKTIKEGNGAVLEDQTKVTVHYTIKTPDDKILSDTFMRGQPIQISLLETIPGFATGLKGMKVGEIRELFIHPSLAYGIFTRLDKGIYLKAYVQLLEINNRLNENNDQSFEFGSKLNRLEDEMIDLDLTVEMGQDFNFRELSKAAGYEHGYNMWEHYKKEKLYELAQIVNWIERFESGENSDISSQKSQDLINRLHWNIYHSE